jgi:hypothetical protein
MDGLDIAAFVVMALMAGIGIGLFVFLGSWPGRVARNLNHPYAEAISIGGWITLVVGGVGWPFILIWAYAVPAGTVDQIELTHELPEGLEED